MVNYKDLGLVNTREMFKRAVAGGYAIPAFNFNTMEQMQAIVMAAVETKSPVIMQVSKGARNYANATILRYMAEGAVAYAKELGCAHPEIVLHLFLVVVGDRDECLAEDNSETVNALYLWHAYDVRTMSTQELGMWQEVFELLHGHE